MAVRRERVILELEDQFTTPMARAAAATALLNKELDDLSGNAVRSSRATRSAERDVDGLGRTSGRTEKDIDKLSGRMRILAETAAIIAPSMAPIGAVSVAAIGGMANQLGFAAVGAATAVLAFQGVGDALKALNKADLEPTTENLQAAEIALERLSPAAASFTARLALMKPQFESLRDTAATGMFPGLERGLDGLEEAFPRVQKIVSAISTEVGNIAGDAGQSLGSKRWAPFLDFLAEEGPSSLRAFATAAGNSAHALAELWMASDPLNDGFSAWLVDATASLDSWAAGLADTQGFADFVSYVESTGPQVAETLGAMANAALQIVEAMAPLGGPVLKGLEAVADLVSSIANSDLGTPIFVLAGGLSLINRTMSVGKKIGDSALGGYIKGARTADGQVKRLSDRIKNMNVTAKGLGRVSLGLGGIAIAATGAADAIGLTNTAGLAMTGAAVGGSEGGWIGGLVGAAIDFTTWDDELEAATAKSGLAARKGDIDAINASVKELQQQSDGLQQHTGIMDFIGDWQTAISSNPFALFGAMDETVDQIDSELRKLANAKDQLESETRIDMTLQGIDATVAGIDSATQSTEEWVEALREADAYLTGRGAMRAYEAAIDDFSETLKKNGKTLDINTKAGRENQAGLDAIAGSALKTAESITDPILRTKFLDNARAEFIKAAREAGLTRRAARRLANEVGLLNLVKGRARFDASELDKGITRARTLLDLLNQTKGGVPQGTKTDKPIPKTAPPKADPDDGWGPMFPSDGATVPKTGKPYADRHPALLADGEEVISNRFGQADRHRGLLKAINANRLANGGTAGIPKWLGGYVRGDLDMKAPSSLKQWNEALKASTRLLNKEQAKREELISQSDELKSAISSNYRTQLFGNEGDSSVWMSAADRAKKGKGDAFSALTGDITNLKALGVATKQLGKKGLDGGALAELLSTGSLSEVQAFASGSKADVLRYEALFNQRERLIGTTGGGAATAAFGAQLVANKAQLAESKRATEAMNRVAALLRKHPKATAAAIAKAINGSGPRRPRR